jgi:hypothetical protein
VNSPLSLELELNWRRERLLQEAEAERLASRVRTPKRSVVRARMAAALYALADWLDALERSPSEVRGTT